MYSKDTVIWCNVGCAIKPERYRICLPRNDIYDVNCKVEIVLCGASIGLMLSSIRLSSHYVVRIRYPIICLQHVNFALSEKGSLAQK